MREKIIAAISNIEYNLFVVNTHAVAVQGEDGKYYTKYLPVTPFILQNMIARQGSLGCYQQVYGSNFVRWLCLDFDCRKDTPVDLPGLYRECVLPVVEYLESRGVRFLLEFSGRRGIHIWIVLSGLIKKSLGYRIICRILEANATLQEMIALRQYGLDKFPATGVNKPSKVGKQVKFPLSYHKKGSRSFFFAKQQVLCSSEPDFISSDAAPLVLFLGLPTDIDDKLYMETEDFYQSQLAILETYEPETKEDFCSKLGIEDEDRDNLALYTQYSLIQNHNASLAQIIHVLSEIAVYRNIFTRMERGQALVDDWLVLLGTFSCFDSCEELLTALFANYPNYDVDLTIRNIKKLKHRYYPATFGYLYRLYHMTPEPFIKTDMTGVDYLAEKLSFDVRIKTSLRERNENKCILSPQNIVNKERSYLWENDEVVSVDIFNKLLNIRDIEAAKIAEYVNCIVCPPFTSLHAAEDGRGKAAELFSPLSYKVYKRLEEGGRIRRLVTLDVFDRLITTSLALRLCREMKHTWESYSYRVSYLDAAPLFYPWFSSWSRYINQIKVYLDLPFMRDNSVLYLDLKHCYDNIDILVIYNHFKSTLTKSGQQAFEYLCAYNDTLMKEMNQGIRIGVPQGPAYARILTEIYLDEVIGDILSENGFEENFQVFRYVDDIVVFSANSELSAQLFECLRNGFGKRGLPVNTVKSRNYGLISGLSSQDKDELLHRSRFNYDLIEKTATGVVFDSERQSKLMRYLRKNPFQINLLGYIFSNFTFETAKQYYFRQYGNDIMASHEGRGKYFRQFYKYLLSNVVNIRHAVINGWFSVIPLDSINFSNFITTFYFMVKNHEISQEDASLIVLFYLNDEFDLNLVSEDDRATVEAIQIKFMIG